MGSPVIYCTVTCRPSDRMTTSRVPAEVLESFPGAPQGPWNSRALAALRFRGCGGQPTDVPDRRRVEGTAGERASGLSAYPRHRSRANRDGSGEPFDLPHLNTRSSECTTSRQLTLRTLFFL